MRDVTASLNAFRECVRHVWNLHLLPGIAGRRDGWSVRDEFDDVCGILFGLLVVKPLAIPGWSPGDLVLQPSRRPGRAPMSWLRVIPRGAPSVPIMINRHPEQAHGYWDHPLDRVSEAEVDMRFVSLFDFDELAFRDFKYFLVRIANSSHPEVIGRAALIECEYARVMLDEAGPTPDAVSGSGTASGPAAGSGG